MDYPAAKMSSFSACAKNWTCIAVVFKWMLSFTMWFDAPETEVKTDKAPLEAQWIGWAAAAFAFPVVIIALTWLEPLTKAAAAGVGVG